MKRITSAGCLFFSLGLLILAACKGSDNPPPAPAQPTKAVVKILSQGTLAAGTKIGGVDVTLALPPGVTVKAIVDPQNSAVYVTDTGVVAASGGAAGSNTSVLATYATASSGAPGTVVIHLANADGFSTGEFVTVNCDISVGSFPKAAEFGLSGLGVVDLNGAAIAGLTAGLTAAIN